MVVKDLGVQCMDSVLDMVKEVNVVILAVKPHQALPLLSKHSFGLCQPSKGLVSVVAGVTIQDLRKVSSVSNQPQRMCMYGPREDVY